MLGHTIKLEPLSYTHTQDLFAHCGGDDELWRWMPVATPRTEDEMRQIIWTALAQRDAGEREPFAVILRETGEAIGSTSFLDIVPTENRLEIGWTFYGQEFWRSAVNTEAKLLLLTEAFEHRGLERVSFKTDHANQRSQAALERLGAVREGLWRHHRRRPDGSWRDSVWFSILSEEWPTIKARLEMATRRDGRMDS